MVQNVFTFTHLLTGKTNGDLFDFKESIQRLTNEGWTVRQVSTATYMQASAPFLVLTILAEKNE